MTDRRQFLALTAAIAATPAIGATRDPLAGKIVVNALGGLGDPNIRGERDGYSPRVLREAHASGVTVVNCTLGSVAGPKNNFEDYVRDVAHFDAMVRRYLDDLVRVETAADIRRAKAAGKIGLIYGFQNLAMVGDDPRRVDIFADMGVRVFQLTYNLPTQLGDGSLVPDGKGLTDFGKQVVDRLNAKRVMVDLSHSGRRICLDAARYSKAPISINHTGCSALMPHPRNKTDEELRLVAERGGFVGIYFMPYLDPNGHATAAEVVAHIDHAVNVCGEDHVGIGTDGSITQIDDVVAYEAAGLREYNERKAAGIAAPGEGPGVYPFVNDLRGPDQFRKLARLLAAKGYSPRRIDNILGQNFLRYAGTIWG